MNEPAARFDAVGLIALTSTLLVRSGIAPDRAGIIATLLVEGDLLGHTTHGLALLPGYLQQIASGGMATSGEPELIVDRPAVALWDGRRLPGLWLADRAVETACARAHVHGIAAVSIRNSGHIGCLAVFLERPAREGFLVMVSSSDPASKGVAPFGGTAPLLSPNPVAVGIPTGGDPIMIDVSTSITTVGMARRLRQSGGRFPAPWAVDATGAATDDPAVLGADPPGALLPVGGLDHGHKGYALSLFVEALTQAVSGFGRADPPNPGGASVWIQVIDPALFAGTAAFNRQTSWLADACRATPAKPGAAPVRLPGEQGLARKRDGLANGVRLDPALLVALQPWAERWEIGMPSAR
jgi:LDH2 family malate/lactate/ureidoglycolate dehydrogenase